MTDLNLRLRLEAEVAQARRDIAAVKGDVTALGLATKDTSSVTLGDLAGEFVKVDGAVRTAKDSSHGLFAELEQLASGYDGLRMSVDSTYAAQTRYADGLALTRMAVASGIATEQEAAATLDLLAQKLGLVDMAATGAKNSSLGLSAALEQQAAAYDALRMTVDGTYAAETRFAQAVDLTRTAVASGITTEQEAAATLDLLAQKLGLVEGKLASGGTMLQGHAMSSGAAAAASQNLAYQFNDVAVMAAAGQNPLMLAMQQGTQIGQIFGQAGAAGAVGLLKQGFMAFLNPMTLVTVGLIAGGAALVQWVASAGDAISKSAELTAQIDDLNEAIAEAKTAGDGAGVPLDKLVEKYGNLAASVQAARVQLKEAAFGKAEDQFRGLVGSFADSKSLTVPMSVDLKGLDQVSVKIDALTKKMIDAQTKANATGTFYDATEDTKNLDDLKSRMQNAMDFMRAIRDDFNLTRAQAVSVASALAQVDEAKTTNDRVVALEAVKAQLVSIFGSTQAADRATNGWVTALSAAVVSGADLASITGDIGDGMTGAAGGAIGLAQQLRNVGSWAQDAKTKAAAMADGISRVSGMMEDAGVPTKLLGAYIKFAADEANRLAGAGPGAGWLSGAISDVTVLIGKLIDARTLSRFTASLARPAIMDPSSPGYLANQYGQYGAGHAAMDAATDPLFNPPAVPIVTGTGTGTGSGSSGGGGSGPAKGSLADVTDQAKQAMDTLDLAIAAINEKVKAGLMSTAEAADAVASAKGQAADKLAELIADLGKLGPAGQAAADTLRTNLNGLAADLKTTGLDLSKTLSEGFKSPFKDFLTGAKSAQDAMGALTDYVIDKFAEMAAEKATTGVIDPILSSLFSGIGGLFGGAGGAVTTSPIPAPRPFADGGVPDGAPLSALRNQVLDKPRLFPMARGMGLMAEAGTEAIMPVGDGGVLAMMGGREIRVPLVRGVGGRLGVELPDAGQTQVEPFLRPFADGGVPDGAPLSTLRNKVLDKPTLFPMARGMGLMAEAGTEAIMPVGDGGVLAMMGGREIRVPLVRGVGGRLGVELPEWQGSMIERAPMAFAKGGMIQGGMSMPVGNYGSSAGGSTSASPKVTVKVKPPAGHTAEVNDRMEGSTQVIDVIVQQVEGAMAGNLRAGRGAHAAALADTFGLRRTPR